MPALAIRAAWTTLIWVLWLGTGEVNRAAALAPHAAALAPPWPFAADAARAALQGLLGAGAVVLALLDAGRVVLRWAGWRRHRSPIRALVAAGAGIPVVALAAQAAGLAGLFHPVLLAGGALGAATVGVARAWWRRPHSAARKNRRITGRTGDSRRTGNSVPLPGVVRVVIGAGIAVVGVAALAPEVAWDAAVYHLRAPELWRFDHRVTPPWGIPHAFFPFNGEMLMAAAAAIGGDRAAKLLHVAAWAGSAGLVAALGRVWGGPAAGGWAAALFVATPLGMVVASRAYIEYFVVLPVLGAAWLIGRRPGARPAAVAVAGWLAGAAMGAKYQGAFPAAVLAVAVVIASRRRVTTSLVFALAAVAAAGSWGIRNLLWTGNPVFPAVWGGARFTPEDLAGLEADARAFRDHLQVLGGLPRLLLGGGESDGGWSPALVALLVIPLLSSSARRVPGWRWVASLAAIWWLTAPVLRFLLPGHAMACAAAGASFAMMEGSRTGARGWRPVTVAGLVAGLAAGVSGLWYSAEPFGAAVGRWSDDEYLGRRFEPDGWVETRRHLAGGVPRTGRVYYMGHAFAIGLPRRSWTDLPYLRPHLFWMLQGAADARRVGIRVRQSAITHIAHNPAGAVRIFGERAAGMSWAPAKRAAWGAYWRGHARLDARIGPWRIFRLERPAGVPPSRPGPVPGVPPAW